MRGEKEEDDQFYLRDISNRHRIVPLNGVILCPWKARDCPFINYHYGDENEKKEIYDKHDKHEQWKYVGEGQGLVQFNSNHNVKGRWIQSHSVGAHFTLYHHIHHPLQYKGLLIIQEDAVICELQGERTNQDAIALQTVFVHTRSTATPDYASHLKLTMKYPSKEEEEMERRSISFSTISLTSSIQVQIPPIHPPSCLLFHSHYHSGILTSPTPTTILNTAPVKQWGMALIVLQKDDHENTTPIGFLKGSHTWDLLIKRCTTQYMGVGVATLGTKFTSYLGRDYTGWSFQPTGEKWHANIGYKYGPDRPSYGEGDVISVELDLNEDTLAFYKNNHYLGIAFSNLQVELASSGLGAGLFPAVTSYRAGDLIEVIGLRNGVITDLYMTDEKQSSSSSLSPSPSLVRWKATWVQGVRHGLGIQEFCSGEQRYGIWKEGLCEGCVVSVMPTSTTVYWYEHGQCLGEATAEQIHWTASMNDISSISSSISSPSSSSTTTTKTMINALQAISLSPPSSKPAEVILSSITGKLDVSPLSLFALSSQHCAAGITLSSDRLTATCTSSSRCMLLGTRALSTGRYYWEVRVNACEIGSIFIGVAALLPGSSHQCWRDFGFVNNHMLQSHALETYYGIAYCKGDVIGVYVDMDLGHLSFVKYGKEFYYSHHRTLPLGLACHHLRTDNSPIHQSTLLYPSFGFKHMGDSITILADHCVEGESLSAEYLLQSYFCWSALRDAVMLSSSDSMIGRQKAQSIISNRLISHFASDHIIVLSRVNIPVELARPPSLLNQEMVSLKPDHRIVGVRGNQIWYYDKSNHEFWYYDRNEVEQQWHMSSLSIYSPVADPFSLGSSNDKTDLNERMISMDEIDWNIVFDMRWVVKVKEWVATRNELISILSFHSIPLPLPTSLQSLSLSTVSSILVLLQLIDEFSVGVLPLVDWREFSQSFVQEKFLSQSLFSSSSSSLSSSSSSLSSSFNQFNQFISFETKKRLLQSILDVTAQHSLHFSDSIDPINSISQTITIPEFRICRIASKKAQLMQAPTNHEPTGETSHSDDSMKDFLTTITHHSLLNQLATHLETLPIPSLRRQHHQAEDAGQGRCFYVRLVGEGVYDSGGPYREIITEACSDNPFYSLPLTTHCGNTEGGMTKEELFQVQASSAYPTFTRDRLLFYWGVLIGIAVRGNITLSLPLSLIFWKQLVQDAVEVEDLCQSDDGLINAIRHLSELCSLYGDARNVIALLPCSSKAKQALTQMLYRNRRREPMDMKELSVKIVCEVMRDMQNNNQPLLQGITTVLPRESLALFTPSEMRELFCGRREVSTLDLKAIAEYGEGIDDSTPVIILFWKVVESFTSDQRSRLLEFVCARKHIPTPPSPPISFKILLIRGNDRVLPQSQTCFSILKIPMYSCEEVMCKQLLYAIENSPTMELDVQLHDAEGWS